MRDVATIPLFLNRKAAKGAKVVFSKMHIFYLSCRSQRTQRYSSLAVGGQRSEDTPCVDVIWGTSLTILNNSLLCEAMSGNGGRCFIFPLNF